MPVAESRGSQSRRKTQRTSKPQGSLNNDLSKADLAKSSAGKNPKMPEGWNPSDDSEDEYTPAATRNTAKKDEYAPAPTRNTAKKDEYTPAATRNTAQKRVGDDEEETAGKLQMKKVKVNQSGAEGTASNIPLPPVKVKPEKDAAEKCVICSKELQGAGGNTNMRFHLASEHYFPEGSFKDLAPAKAEDMVPGAKLPKDLMGKVHKYTCQLQPCTKRKQGYKELVLHLATQHHKLKEVMALDSRPGVAAMLANLYPAEEEQKPAVRVKQEKEKVTVKEPDNSEDVDDPTSLKTLPPANVSKPPQVKPKTVQQVQPRVQQVMVQPQTEATKKAYTGPRIDKVHTCMLCETRDGRNLSFGSGLSELRNHYSVCFYNRGQFVGIADPGDENRDPETGKAVDEYGRKYKYKCSVPACPRNQNKAKSCGFKEWVIHAGVAHHLVERVMEVEAEKNMPMKEVLLAVRAARETQGVVLEEMPRPSIEEIHNCVLCKDRDGLNLSLDPAKLWAIRYHYASCFFDSGVYLTLGGAYLPGEQNVKEDGTPRDMLGQEVRYRCIEEGCTMKRQVGYKELCIHMASDHGGLEEVMSKDERHEIRNLVPKMKKKKN